MAAPDSVHHRRHLAEDEKAGSRHPDQPEIDERRERRRRRDAVGKDQQPMAEPAPEAERGEQQPTRDVRAAIARSKAQTARARRRRRAAYRSASPRADRRRRDSAWRGCRAHSRTSPPARSQHGPMHRAETRMHHEQHAEKAGDDGQHAMPANPFAEQRPGKRRDQQRREKEDGDGLVELEISQRDEIEPRGDDHERRADDLDQRLRRAERRLEGERPQHDGAEHRRGRRSGTR